MVTIYKVEKSNIEGEGKFLVELRGLADDNKPTSLNGGIIQNGSTYTEIDTGNVYMYDLENTTWYKVASGNGGSEPMEKFDYIIPTISFDPAETTATISNTTITDMLDEMSTRLKTEAEPLLIGLYLHDDDVGCDDFILLSYSLDPDSDYVTLKGLSYSFGLVTINNESNTWKIYHTNI